MKNASSVCGLFAICCIFSCGAVDVYTDITNGSDFDVYLTVKPDINGERLSPGEKRQLVNCGTVSYRFDKPWRVQVHISRHDYRNEYVFSNAPSINVHIINTTDFDVTLTADGYMTRISDWKSDPFIISPTKSKEDESEYVIFTRSPLFSAVTADDVPRPRVVEYAIYGTVMTVVIL
jgi:hypothetical protein